MSDLSRSQLYPENRSRSSRAQITCPRCRVDPSHISRQYWEATRQQQQSTTTTTSAEIAPSVLPSQNSSIAGYPDLCPRQQNPSSSANYRPQSTLPANPPQARASSSSNYYYHHQSQPSSSSLGRHVDNQSTRSSETWRIRGVFDNHAPDVTLRSDSNQGPLPDVTRHSARLPQTRIPPTNSNNATYEPEIQSLPTSSRYPESRHRSYTATASSSFREPQTSRRSEIVNSIERRSAPPHWKREPLGPTPSSSGTSPWATTNRTQSQERTQSYNNHSGNSVNTTNSNNNNSVQQAPPQSTVSSSCWRSSTLTAPQHVLSQCPLPDLVTPRRQARKQCCGLLATHSVAVRWLVVAVALLGVLCSIVGTVIGVLRVTGKEHLSIALLLIGLGIVLVSMSGIAWRLTSRDAPSCRAMFGFRRARSEPHRRFVPRVPHYGRPHPFSAMLYPDIPLRPPPPSYQASMQEYRLRLLLMDRPPQMPSPAPLPPQHPPPPPPTYRGPTTVYPRFPINLGPSDYSRPPSYRSRPPSSVGQPSPLGSEEVEINIPAIASNNHNNINSAVLPSEGNNSTSNGQQQTPAILLGNQPRPAPSTGGNHVEVVAQV